jgi:hypothetical protein
MTPLPDPRTHAGADTGDSAATRSPTRPTGLESECLRHAIHDMRGALNTSSLLLDLMVDLTSRDPALATAKAPVLVRELQSMARMLDQLIGASDSLAPDLVPVDLGALAAAAVSSSRAFTRGVAVDVQRLRGSCWVRSCAKRLSRALGLVVERCVDALPDGGSIDVAIADAPPAKAGQAAGDTARLVFVIRGERVLGPAAGRPRLQASKDGDSTASTDDWFPILALVRGVGGDLHIERRGGAELRLLLDVPRSSLREP